MRALKRAVAVGVLAAPLVIGCAGLASAHSGGYSDGFFTDPTTTDVGGTYVMGDTMHSYLVHSGATDAFGSFNGAWK